MGHLAWPPRLLLAVLVLLAVLGAGRLASAAQEPPPAAAPPPAPLPRPVTAAPACSSPPPPARPSPARPSQELLGAFGVLRRERTSGDALPAAALRALRGAGLEPAGADTARLLRTTSTGGKAWVVPVADVRRALSLGVVCAPVVVPRTPPRGPRRPARPIPRPLPAPPSAPRRPGRPVAPPLPAPAGPVTVLPPEAPLEPVARGPVEGVAVVALGDAAPGGGGSRADLVRGRAPVDVDPCAGPRRDMLGVSGIVPDGVAAAYLTSPDGTAVRADVRDNAFAFVVPRTAARHARYVVWTGADGTPHVQPVGAVLAGQRACRTLRRIGDRAARVTPRPGCRPAVALPVRGRRGPVVRTAPAMPCLLLAAPRVP
jgi:hypothetical protein